MILKPNQQMRLKENLDNVGKKHRVRAEMASGCFSPSGHRIDSVHMDGCRGQYQAVCTMVLSAVRWCFVFGGFVEQDCWTNLCVRILVLEIYIRAQLVFNIFNYTYHNCSFVFFCLWAVCWRVGQGILSTKHTMESVIDCLLFFGALLHTVFTRN